MNKTYYDKIRETIYREKLDNGLKITISLKKGFKKFMVLFGTNLGSFVTKFKTEDGVIHEVPLGVAHFLEHKMFAMPDGHDAINDFSKYGLEVNAFTAYNQTVYLFTGTEYLKEGINLLLDFVQEPYFTDENVESEKGIITQELNMYLDNPVDRLYNGLLNNMFTDFPIKYDVGGTIEEVNRTTKEDLYLCYENYYHPSNMEFLVVGDVDPKEVINIIKENQNNKTFKEYKSPVFIYKEEGQACDNKAGSIKMDVNIPKTMVGLKLPFTHSLEENEVLVKEILYKIMLEYAFGNDTSFYKKLVDNHVLTNEPTYNVYLDEICGYISLSADTLKPEEFIKEVEKRFVYISKAKLSERTFIRLKKAVIGSMIKAFNNIEYIGYNYFDYNNKNCDLFKSLDVLLGLSINDFKKISINFKKDALSSFIIYPKHN